MANLFEDPQDTVWISIPLDGETAARLQSLSNDCHAEPVSVAASLLHDLLKDDEEANLPTARAAGSLKVN